MNIWFLHHYAEPPDGQWTATHELAKELVKRGHQVTVLAASFNHYTREDSRLGRGQLKAIQHFDGVRFVLLKTYPYGHNDWRRALNILSYAMMALWAGLRIRERPDVIIGATPHPLAPLAAYVLSLLKRSHFLLQLRDLWPLFPLEVGLISKRNPIVPLARWIERFCLRRAKAVVTTWPGMTTYLDESGISPSKAVWIPIGVDLSKSQTVDAGRENLRPETFVVMYRGGFGISNDIKSILDAASILQTRGEDHIKFILAGDGATKPTLLQYAGRLDLRNVEFHDFVPREQLPSALAQADAFICSLLDVPHFQKYAEIPSKLLDYLSSQRLIVLGTNNDSNLVHAAKAGIVVPPADPEALARAITDLAAMQPQERATMGRNGLQYVRENHDITLLGERLERALTEVVG